MRNIVIRQIQPEDQIAVRSLILGGLEEHWGKLDLTKNADLDDIAGTFGNGLFLVAWEGKEIVGCGGLIRRDGGVAQIARMSVAARRRRQGIGTLILNELCRGAKELQCTEVVLETTATWPDAIGFYRKHGFRVTHEAQGDIYFSLAL